MKLAVVIAAYRLADAGKLDLDQSVKIRNEFVSATRTGTGIARFSMDRAEDSDPEPWRRMGCEVALRWLCYRTIVRSSNLATNLVLDHVGVDAVTETLIHLGATNSVVSRGIEDAPARAAGLDNLVTAADLGLTFQALAADRAASPPACREILSVLGAQQINDALPAGLPRTRVAHKSGWIEGCLTTRASSGPPTAHRSSLPCTTSDLEEQEGLDLVAAGAAAAWRGRKVLG